MSDQKPKRKIKPWMIWLGVILILGLLIYFYSYFFAKANNKVIYQDAQRRIYLNDKKEYKKGREMWRMVYEDQKTGQRWFVLGNSKKGFNEKKMARVILNTIDKGQKQSFDQVDQVGVVIKLAKTDVHSNLIEKKGIGDFIPADILPTEKDFQFFNF